MNDVRIGEAIRTVRVRRHWRQRDLAQHARVSPGVVSLIERGFIERVSVRAFRRVVAALGIRSDVRLTLPHGELDRLMNAGHAALHEALARHIGQLPGWLHAPEVSFAIYGERGVIDILAFHPPTRSLLVIELKTELVSLEDLLTTMDVRMRHALTIARGRGWNAEFVSGWVVIAESATNRRRVAAHRSALRSAFPADGRAMRGWLHRPSGPIKALSFWANSTPSAVRRVTSGRRRVRVRASEARSGQTSSAPRV